MDVDSEEDHSDDEEEERDFGDGALGKLTELEPEQGQSVDTLAEVVDMRYSFGDIYSSAGPLLLALNPCGALPRLYSRSTLSRYARLTDHCSVTALPAHLFGVLSAAYHRVLASSRLQSVAVVGEIGSGKQKSTSMALDFLLALPGGYVGARAGQFAQRFTKARALLRALLSPQNGSGCLWTEYRLFLGETHVHAAHIALHQWSPLGVCHPSTDEDWSPRLFSLLCSAGDVDLLRRLMLDEHVVQSRASSFASASWAGSDELCSFAEVSAALESFCPKQSAVLVQLVAACYHLGQGCHQPAAKLTGMMRVCSVFLLLLLLLLLLLFLVLFHIGVGRLVCS
jgi:Myosin head (motor domain)